MSDSDIVRQVAGVFGLMPDLCRPSPSVNWLEEMTAADGVSDTRGREKESAEQSVQLVEVSHD